MLVILYGVDSYSRHQAVQRLRASLDSDGMLATNTTLLDGRRLTFDELRTVCDALPFLGSARLVHVRGLLGRSESDRTPGARAPRARTRTPAAAPEDTSGGWLPLADYATQMPPTTTLLLEDSRVGASNTLLKALEPVATVQRFSAMEPRELLGWLAARVRRDGIAIDPEALRLLAESASMEVADDGQWHALWGLTGDFEKLRLYTGSRRITAPDVRRLVPAAVESRVYLLSDLVVERQGAAAMVMLEELLAFGRPAPVILATLAGHYRQLLLIRELREAGAGDGDIRRQLGIASEFRYTKLRAQADRLTLATLEGCYRRLLESDRAVKTGRTDDVTAIELAVAELASV